MVFSEIQGCAMCIIPWFRVCELAVFVNAALKWDWSKTKGEFLCFVYRNYSSCKIFHYNAI